MSDEAVVALASAIRELKSLTTLHFRGNVDPQYTSCAGARGAPNVAVTHVVLCCAPTLALRSRQILHVLPYRTPYTFAHLISTIGLGISDKGVVALASAIGELKSLTTLHLQCKIPNTRPCRCKGSAQCCCHACRPLVCTKPDFVFASNVACATIPHTLHLRTPNINYRVRLR